MKAEAVIDAIELLSRQTPRKPGLPIDLDPSERRELDLLFPEFLTEIYRLANLESLEAKIVSARRVDLKCLREILETIKKFSPQKYKLEWSTRPDAGKVIDPAELMQSLDKDLGALARNSEKWNPIEIAFRIELVLDSQVNDLMMAFPWRSLVYDEVCRRLLEHTAAMKDGDVLLLWARLLDLFKGSERREGLRAYPDILDSEFFAKGHPVNKIREKIVWFVVKFFPQIMRRMISEGVTTFPAGFPGIARLATFSFDDGLFEPSNLDLLTVRLTSETIAMWEGVSLGERGSLAGKLKLVGDGFIFDGEYYREFKTRLDKHDPDPNVGDLLLMMKRLHKYAQEYHTSTSDVAQALWLYKLGQEVIAPSQTPSIKSGAQKELDLQKSLSRYLVERGILSYGRSFGRSSIDLHTRELGEDFVIETKVYKTRPTEALIRANLVQLSSYMDQSSQPRGILAIYNVTNDLVLSPRRWIGGRIWILVMNIGDAPPSKRVRSLEVLEAEDGQSLVRFVENDGRAGPADRGASKKRRKVAVAKAP